MAGREIKIVDSCHIVDGIRKDQRVGCNHSVVGYEELGIQIGLLGCLESRLIVGASRVSHVEDLGVSCCVADTLVVRGPYNFEGYFDVYVGRCSSVDSPTDHKWHDIDSVGEIYVSCAETQSRRCSPIPTPLEDGLASYKIGGC